MVIVNRFLVFVVAVFFSATSWAAVTASVDRNQLIETETLTLTITATGDSDGKLDLSLVEALFDVLSTSHSSSFSYTNGQMESKQNWFISLAPKRQGTLQIPAIDFGDEKTQPIPIVVLPPSAAESLGEVPAIFMEVAVEPKQAAYVQSQIAYSLKIFYATELQSGRLSELTLDDAMVERLGEDRSYQSVREGRRYNVIERRYAIFPQSSGTLDIPEMTFQGSVRVQSSKPQRRDSFFDPFGRLSSSSKQVRIKSENVSVDVKKRPKNSHGQWWLPAQDFKMAEKWSPENPEFRVGEPVTRTIVMQAKGLLSAQLPELSLVDVAGVKFYPDQPVTQDTDDGVWVVGARQEKIALVPTKAGQYTLPEIAIRWWDTETNSERVAKIPEKIIDVLPALKTAQAVVPVTDLLEDVEMAEKEAPVVSADGLAAAYWPYVSGLLFVAWLLTVIAWLRIRKQLKRLLSGAPDIDKSSLKLKVANTKKQLKQACDANNAKDAQDALLQWASAVAGDSAPQTLGQVALWFDADTAALLHALDQHLYAPESQAWEGGVFWHKLASQLDKVRPVANKTSNQILPPLYSQ